MKRTYDTNDLFKTSTIRDYLKTHTLYGSKIEDRARTLYKLHLYNENKVLLTTIEKIDGRMNVAKLLKLHCDSLFLDHVFRRHGVILDYEYSYYMVEYEYETL